MISGPVIPRTREGLWGQILSRPELLEHGLQLVAQDLTLHEGCTVDGVARDASGRAVALFAVVGGNAVGGETAGLPVNVLEAHSFLQRNGRVLARALPESGIHFADAWRIAVVSMDLSESCLRQISGLGLERVEVYEVEPFTLDGEHRLVVRPVLGHRARGGEDGLHVPSGLLDPAQREIATRFLQLLERLDPKVRVDGDRFSRRLTLGPARLADLWVDEERTFVAVGETTVELLGEEDHLEISDLLLRRYLELFAARRRGRPAPGGGSMAREVGVGVEDRGLSLEPLRRSVAETRISREEFSALGDSSSIDNG